MVSNVALITETPQFEAINGLIHITYKGGEVHAMRPHDLMLGITRAHRALAAWRENAAEPIPLRKSA